MPASSSSQLATLLRVSSLTPASVQSIQFDVYYMANTITGDLSMWAWSDSSVSASSYKFDKAWGVDHVLRAVGISDKATKDGGSIQVVKVAHGDADANGGGYGPTPYNSQPQYTVGDKSYRVTGSEYTFGFDSSGGEFHCHSTGDASNDWLSPFGHGPQIASVCRQPASPPGAGR
ncbi:hypothetical protein C7974DRAFT_402688 [Boeremia exigua]|uniref:uncharacterized protein n=1 Tax=Boeremia exigua TaxID=749465 RepID=UPI001E8D8D2B|nr:uncharacterized protein C7974DRAFT_402688 [Boeremia exigua]KAH6614818.1 hypothetical protein C7974DRAFT_402688 [Boeremia exigua]